jgi:hypothetical protein
MGRRSYAMRHYRRSRSRYYTRGGTSSLSGGSVVILLIAGLFTWGVAWVILLVLICVEAPPLKVGDFRTRKPAPQPPVPAVTPEAVNQIPSTEPPARSTAWAYEPRNLGGSHTVITTQFRPCKPDDDQPT